METASVTIRMDKELKRQAETVFAEMGMNMTTAITVFTKAVVRQGKIPFEIAIDPVGQGGNSAYLREAIAALGAGKGTAHELIEADDAEALV